MGAGMWIWNMRRCERGNTTAIVQKAQSLGLSHLVVKIMDGPNLHNGNLLRPVFAAMQSAGIKAYAWTYTYGDNPEAEAEAFGERGVALDARALIVDAEGDRYDNSPARARRFIRRLRQTVGSGRHIGLSSFHLLRNQPEFPAAAFMEECDSGWPQAYYLHQGPGLEPELNQVLRDWQRFGKPLVVTGAAYPEGLGPNVTDIRRVAAWCAAHGITQVNFWSWEHATPQMWAEIGAAAA